MAERNELSGDASASPNSPPPQVKPAPPDFNEQTNYVPVKTIITIFLACATVDLLALMDQTMLGASLTIISSDLNARSESSWIAGAYFLTSTSFQLLYGRLSDIWSRKAILLTGIFLFFLGSLASSLAQTALQLIVFRAFTGVGGGGLMTVAQMIVSDIVPLRERGKYQGILGAVVAIANGIGPVVGAALAERSEESWRWIFRLNFILTVFTTGMVWFFMPLKKVQGDWRKKVAAIDFIGAFLALGGSTLLVLALTWAGGEYPWQSSHVIASLVVGCLVSIGFIFWQWKGTSVPLIPMHIFKIKLVDGAMLTMFVNGWNFLVQVFYIPSFYQLVYGYSAVRSGILLLPIVLMQTITSTLSGLVVHWTGRYRESILAGWVVWAVGIGLFSTLDASSSLGKQIGYGLLTGFGVGQTLQPSLIAIQAGVDRKQMAIVTSVRNFSRNLGGTLGLAVAGTIINNSVRMYLLPLGLSSEDVRLVLTSPSLFRETVGASRAEEVRLALLSAYQKGFRIVFLVGASLAACSFVAAWFTMPQVGLKRDDDDKLKEEGKRQESSEKTQGQL